MFELVRVPRWQLALPHFFWQLADELWPEGNTDSGEERVGSTSETLSLEAQIAREMSVMQAPRKQKHFGNENALSLSDLSMDNLDQSGKYVAYKYKSIVVR